MTYDQFDIVLVDFPFVDNTKTKPRPVIIISSNDFMNENGHCIACMITTAMNTKWKYDTEISTLQITGLKTKSYIRQKLFTLDLSQNPRKIGKLSAKDTKKFRANFKKSVF